ncbi:hypothetical protein GCM10011575_29010 [Microlunatus endophyticus]|uniref:Uncharacterized protein n=1 Tax=Microlunatus endophyticus TaxID=1716077 RepID=A0A917SBP5_9ACTN|nr:hypothetical protein [Microlunatus endophyticus]GGL68622.1 hypothetical protein GCM10011575_29010 [Microlunatus endophyticus]
MNTAVMNAADQPVIAWPKITATLGTGAEQTVEGTLVINGVPHRCRAASTDLLRTGMIAKCTATAIMLGRPVRVEVIEAVQTDDRAPSQSWTLAVRPDGIVQELDSRGRIVGTGDDLLSIEGPCRGCGISTPVTSTRCTSCGTAEPLAVAADQQR